MAAAVASLPHFATDSDNHSNSNSASTSTRPSSPTPGANASSGVNSLFPKLLKGGAEGVGGLAQFTVNPIRFVPASASLQSSGSDAGIPMSSKYEVLDDSKLSPTTSASSFDTTDSDPHEENESKTNKSTHKAASRFIGPQLPPGFERAKTADDDDDDAQSSPPPSSPASSLPDTQDDPKADASTSAPTTITTPTTANPTPETVERLWTQPLRTIFPTFPSATLHVARGLDNVGNTCFLNSTLQCLIHTPPLLHIALQHHLKGCSTDSCMHPNAKGHLRTDFCMLKALGKTASAALYTKSDDDTRRKPWFRPVAVLQGVYQVARGLRKGRQEDAHEVLRELVESFQRSALGGFDPKLPHSVKETTWVHQVFGGRLRSRVTCQVCHHPSDTFDSVLDLSLDLPAPNHHQSVRAALDDFVKIERLGGPDKYKCEKCKKPVVAQKQFTIHEAPMVLTVHLKRFTPMGRKLTQQVEYGESLSLQRYMSDGQFGPRYSLYGVVCHAGSGPNSGHYVAYTKSAKGTWHEMNDEVVSPLSRPPLNLRSAYILFYMRKPDDEQLPHDGLIGKNTSLGVGASPEKRKRTIPQDEDDEADDDDAVAKRPKIEAPVSPARPDPQAALLKERISAAQNQSQTKSKFVSSFKPAAVLQSSANTKGKAKVGGLLSEYDGLSSEGEDVGEVVGSTSQVTATHSESESVRSASVSPATDTMELTDPEDDGPPKAESSKAAAQRAAAASSSASMSKVPLRDIFPELTTSPRPSTLSTSVNSPLSPFTSTTPTSTSPSTKLVNTGMSASQFYGPKRPPQNDSHLSSSSSKKRKFSENELDRADDTSFRHSLSGSHSGKRTYSGKQRHGGDRDERRSSGGGSGGRKWKVNGGDSFSPAAFRGNLHEDRANGSGSGGFSGARESKKARMKPKARSLM